MSELRLSSLKGRKGKSAPLLPDGAVVTGVTTSTSFDGNITGNVTGNITGTTGSFSGDVSVGGAISYEDVSAVDSVGVITARSGIKVGAGQSISPVSGIVTYYGDGSGLTGVESGVFNFVASGTISNGAAVVVNTDGTVKTPTQTTLSITSAVSWPNQQDSEYNIISHQSGTSKYLVFYSDANDYDYGKCVIGTLNNDKTSFSFGSIVTFDSSDVDIFGAVYVPNIDKHVVIYSDSDNSRALTYSIVYMNGTTPRVDATGVVDSQRADQADICLFGTSKVVIAYQGGGGGTLRAIVGDPSSSSISFGSAVDWGGSGGTEQYAGISTTSDSSKVLVAGRDDKAIARVGTVSGTSISFGAKTQINVVGGTAYGSQWNSVVYDSSTQKNLITFRDGSNGFLSSVVATVSGTSVTVGTKRTHTSYYARYIDSVYQSSNQRILVVYGNEATSNLNYSEMEISGTNVSAANTTALNESFTSYGEDYSVSYDATIDKTIIAFRGNSIGNLGIVTPSGITNLTSENYIGIAAEAISNGQTGKITIVTGINEGQTGLTTGKTYYVQSSGGISTVASSPSVVAGTAISSTKIAVR